MVVGLPWGVTPDGKHLLFSPPGARDLLKVAFGSQQAEPVVQTPATERNGVVSPDGRWLAYESDSSQHFEVYVRPYPNVDAGQWRVSTAGGTRPLWSHSGQQLFYVAPGGAIMEVTVDVRADTWSAGTAAKVVEGPYLTESTITSRTYDVSRDGRRFLVVKRPEVPAQPQIVVVQNWFEDLRLLVSRD
jgi:serine/threonine-protein kinase